MIRESILLTKQINLIGICGHAGSGKDTVAGFLVENFKSTWHENFADPLKRCACEAFGISIDDFYDSDAKEAVNDFWGTTPRKIAQFLGTEFFRDNIHKLLTMEVGGNDFWIRRMKYTLENPGSAYEDGDTLVIADVRFQNEVDFIHDNGGYIITLRRPGSEGNVGISNHASEQLSTLTFNHERTFSCDNDGTLYQLNKKIEQITLDIPFLKPKNDSILSDGVTPESQY